MHDNYILTLNCNLNTSVTIILICMKYNYRKPSGERKNSQPWQCKELRYATYWAITSDSTSTSDFVPLLALLQSAYNCSYLKVSEGKAHVFLIFSQHLLPPHTWYTYLLIGLLSTSLQHKQGSQNRDFFVPCSIPPRDSDSAWHTVGIQYRSAKWRTVFLNVQSKFLL